ncbi:MAG: methylmalonyl-CoA mutase family protein, partial [Betaproteobacteria bacterium]|nr:methylmalonyl-CoA mutase family protein [Betaproteobacteria bacterium]
MNKPLDAGRLSERDTGLERWQREYAAGAGSDKPARNRSGIEVKPLSTPQDWQGDYAAALGYPGQPPYTRGIYA